VSITPLQMLSLAALVLGLAAAVSDLRSGIIPNRVVHSGGLLGLYAAKGLAGGDVKLFMALGALLGPLLGLESQLYGFVCGGLYAFGLLAYQGVLFRTLFASLQLVGLGLFSRRVREQHTAASIGSIRFAPAIFAGSLVAVLSHWSAP
jgi:Flp pilus assembly protein protease CpaA